MTNPSDFERELLAALRELSALGATATAAKVCRCGDTFRTPGPVCAACADQRRGVREWHA
jgi:hypothetical protein